MRPLIVLFACLAFAVQPARGADAPAANADVAEYQQQLKTLAKDDVPGRLKLAAWCVDRKLTKERTALLEQVVRLDPDNAEARAALGYEKVKDRWLHGDELQKAKGLVYANGKWVSAEEAYKAKGWVKHLGVWVSPARLKQIEARQKALQEAVKARADWKNAIEVKTDHFRIKSNTSPYVVGELARSMDACYDALAKVFSINRTVQLIPVEIYATEDQYAEGSANAGFPVSHGMVGYFYYGGSECGIRTYLNGSIDSTVRTLFHECTHLMVHVACGDFVPTWANEGLAVFFEDVERDEGKLDLEAVPYDRLWHLQQQLKQETLSLNHLCKLKGAGQYSVEYYPQGWSLIYFLLYADKGKRLPQFEQFYSALRKQQQRDPIEQFKDSFGVDPDSLASSWRPYMEKMEPTTGEELARAATAAVEGWMDFEKATAYADAAIAKAPDDWKVQRAVGRVHLCLARFSRDASAAGDEYRKAADAFAKAREGKAKSAKKPKAKTAGGMTFQDEQLCLDHARACIGAGDDATAIDLIESVLANDQLSAPAYTCLALQRVVSADPAVADLAEAKKQLAIADDMGGGHEALYVHARIALAEHDKDAAIKFLRDAAEADAFGFGAHFYRYEIGRLTAGSRRVEE